MKKYILKVLIFASPLLIFISLPLLFLSISKEMYFNLDKIITKDHNKSYLIGFGYDEQTYPYIKYQHLLHHRPYDIISLGSSRVLQFREQMFTGSFYNAGYTINGIKDFQQFLELLPSEKLPKILILGLDQWMFNPNWKYHNTIGNPKRYTQNTFKQSFELHKIRLYSIKFYKDWLFRRKITLNRILNNKTNYQLIGLNAFINYKGIRNDGSMFYGTKIHDLLKNNNTSPSKLFHKTFNRIINNHKRFEYSSTISQESLIILDKLLSFCKEENIHVIGFLPPYADAVYNKLTIGQNYAYIHELPLSLENTFSKYQYSFFNFPNMKSIGSSDKEALDGFHGGETAYLRLIQIINQNDPKLQKYCDNHALQNSLENAINHYLVYEDDPHFIKLFQKSKNNLNEYRITTSSHIITKALTFHKQ